VRNIIRDYGAVPGTDCTAAFAAAFLIGGALEIPGGLGPYLTSANLVMTLPTRLVGDLMTTSTITPNLPPGVDGLTIRPTVGGISGGWGMENIGIAPASPNSMQHAVEIDLSAPGAWLANCSFHNIDLVAGSGADSALHLDNPVNTNGLFCGEITGKSIIVGGVKLLNLGDSFKIEGATLTGPNVGLYATAVPGAAQVKLKDCNITSTGGAFFGQSLNQVQIEGNQAEQSSPYTGPFNGMFVFSGCIDCNVRENNMNSHGNTACVVIENASRGIVVRGNIMSALNNPLLGHVLIGPNCPGNALADDNRYYDVGTGAWPAPYLFINPSSPLWNI